MNLSELIMTFKEFKQIVIDVNKKLMADDPRFENSVLVIHNDGFLLQDNAFYEIDGYDREKHLVVYAEHTAPVIFDMCCVNKYAQFKLLYGETT
jgi:hypothetical protein